jgi:23S rRNA pseudouridine1911/1915/1917 synthase
MLSILFEDHHLIVLNKPAGWLTQAPVEVPSLEREVKKYLKEKYQKPAGVYLGVPHRLDRPVSGVVVFCRNTKAAQRVAEQFQQHTVKKIYLARVEGRIEEPSGTWIDWLRKIPDESRTEIVPPETLGAKEAITDFRVISCSETSSLLELSPRTGRMHQLRICTSHRGHPILGDQTYGSTTPFGPEVELPRDRWIALHAARISFVHPFRKEEMQIEAPVPEALRDDLVDPSV